LAQSLVRLTSKSKCLAERNKRLDGSNATKKCSALRDAEREGPNSNFEPLCQLAPVVNGWGFSAVLPDIVDEEADNGRRALLDIGSDPASRLRPSGPLM
jgi:hypothetical protein